MRFTIPTRRDDIQLAPVAIATAAAIALLGQLLWPIEMPSADAPRMIPKAAAPPLVQPVADAPAVAERSIFSPRRGREPVAAGVAAPVDLDGYALIGTATMNGTAEAILRAPGSATLGVRVGNSVAGWRLVAVRGDVAAFAKGTGQRVLRIGGVPGTPAL